jgi:GNAT superfamily N-acetyltransferase
MEIHIRAMQKDEAKEALVVLKKSFGYPQWFFSPRPKGAIVAVIDEKIVGGLFYKTKMVGKKKLGYIDFLFTDPAHQGKGIGNRLCVEGFKILWEQGCDALLTFVQDDNVASWRQFLKHGFVRTSWPKMVKLLGLPGAIQAKLVSTTFGLAPAYDFYVALPDAEQTSLYEKKTCTARQIAAFMLANMIFVSLAVLRAGDILAGLIAFVTLFFGSICAGYIGTLFSGRKWHFRLTPGGPLISIVTAIAGFFWPANGGWYPAKYENTPKFRRDMAISSIAVWIFLAAAFLSPLAVNELTPLWVSISNISAFLMIIRFIPINSVSSYGARRILLWSKAAYALLLIVAIFILFGIPRII